MSNGDGSRQIIPTVKKCVVDGSKASEGPQVVDLICMVKLMYVCDIGDFLSVSGPVLKLNRSGTVQGIEGTVSAYKTIPNDYGVCWSSPSEI